jgi:hypothetical protein
VIKHTSRSIAHFLTALLVCCFLILPGLAEKLSGNASENDIKLSPEHAALSTDANSFLHGNLTETALEADLAALGISLAAHKPGALPAAVSEIAPGTAAYHSNIEKDDIVLSVEKANLITAITIQRQGKIYTSHISVNSPFNLDATSANLSSNIDKNNVLGSIRKNGGVSRQDHPLEVYLSFGGSPMINSFNGSSACHTLIKLLADLFARASHYAKLDAGERIKAIIIRIDEPGDLNNMSAIDGAQFLFGKGQVIIRYHEADSRIPNVVIDCNRLMNLPEDKVRSSEKNAITLSPLDLSVGIGGSTITNSFNSSTGIPFWQSLGEQVGPHSNYQIKPGGSLAESASCNLRPTVLRFCTPGANHTDSFNEIRAGRRKVTWGGAVQAVPDHPTFGKCRRVIFSIELGGGKITNSFNNSGSLTIIANEFLDYLTEKIDPSVLANINSINFVVQGRYYFDSFNDQMSTNVHHTRADIRD